MSAKLAIDGGTPVKATPNKPMYPGGLAIGDEEKREVMDALDKQYLFRYYGPPGFESKVSAAEAWLASRVGVKHCLATNTCTSSLISALVACGVGPGMEVIVPSVTYWSSASAVLCAKAVPIIAECDDTITLDPNDIENHITPRTRAIMPVHMRGAPCDMDPIMAIAKKHNLAVIEDNAQAMGGTYKGKALGSFGDCGCFSTQYYKILTTGEGGFLTTNDERLYTLAQSVHDSAACWRPDRFAPERFNGELFFGYDFRMGELEGALALAQFRKLDGLLSRMRANKKRILDGIGKIDGLKFRRLVDPQGDTAICVIFFTDTVELCEKFVKALVAEGVDTMHLYHKDIPDWHISSHWLHMINQRTPTDDNCPYKCPLRNAPPPDYSVDMCPKTNDLCSRAVHINVPAQMDFTEADQVAEAVRKVAAAYL